MIGRLNHVGVATPSIEKSIALYRDVLGATKIHDTFKMEEQGCLLYTSPSPRDLSTSRMPSSA